MYRTIDTHLWNDQEVRKLPPPAKLLFLYLITNPHSHVGGIYYLPDVVILHETGLKPEALNTLWDTLSRVGLSRRDQENEVIWVVNMLRYQGNGAKIFRSVANQLRTLHNSSLIEDFLVKYPEVKRVFRHRVSKGYPKLARVGIQEQEQEQDNREEAKASSCSEPDKPASEQPVTYPAFPVIGSRQSKRGGKTWLLSDARIDELAQAFPGIDVRAESRKAFGWIVANANRRKTARGMPRFLWGWMERAQNRSGGNGFQARPGELDPADEAMIEQVFRETP